MTITALFLLALLAACADEGPSDTTGCKPNPDSPDSTAYTTKNGCTYGNILKKHGDEGHGEEGEHSEAEGEHSESEGEHSEAEGEHSEAEGEHSEAEGEHNEAEGEHNEESTPEAEATPSN
jgi:hypothetical protein